MGGLFIWSVGKFGTGEDHRHCDYCSFCNSETHAVPEHAFKLADGHAAVKICRIVFIQIKDFLGELLCVFHVILLSSDATYQGII